MPAAPVAWLPHKLPPHMLGACGLQRRSFGVFEEMLAMVNRKETGKLSRRPVPAHIVLPDYATTGTPAGKMPKAQWMIEQHSEADIALARIAGRISREVLDEAGRAVAEGVTTDEIDRIVHEATIKRGAYPSPLNYHGIYYLHRLNVQKLATMTV